jgi:glycosyltransferase involved in cell wall biosynthesis
VTAKPVLILTDQGPNTGVGTYADALFRLVAPNHPGTRLLYLGSRINELPRWWDAPADAIHLELPLQFPPAVHRNYRSVLEKRMEKFAVHFCGVYYNPGLCPTPPVVTIHDYYPRQIAPGSGTGVLGMMSDLSARWQYLQLEPRVRGAGACIVPSQRTKQCLEAGTSIKSEVIHHWADSERFFPRDQRASRQALSLPLEGTLILNVSAHTSNKNYALLSSIADALPVDCKLVKVGGRFDSKAPVVWLSRLNYRDFPYVFNACDVYLHTSKEEGFGFPLIQAIASRVPVVALRTEITQEVLGDASLLMNPEETGPHEWARAISYAARDGREEILARQDGRMQAFAAQLALARYDGVYRRVFGD